MLVGAITIFVFGGLGLSLWSSGRTWAGVLLTVLAVYRLVAWVREVRIAYEPDED